MTTYPCEWCLSHGCDAVDCWTTRCPACLHVVCADCINLDGRCPVCWDDGEYCAGCGDLPLDTEWKDVDHG